MDIESDAFKNGGYIPDRYTCDAQDFSPVLSWSNAPQATKSFALIVDDPDASFKVWVHWVIFNIPAETSKLKENITIDELSSLGIVQGTNDFEVLDYRGPCPPQGKPHRYSFKLYALDMKLSLEEGATKSELIKAIQGHIIAETKIVVSYQR
ncbi:MAG: YbhB/YbcL family Raf kinase inhibitor-like protein [Candidatus Omnitrophica bacterium]|nr:YbhB/YbcL family Raf kinase inhibitor-like protein [Candidatus Omnitrophota bacterium]